MLRTILLAALLAASTSAFKDHDFKLREDSAGYTYALDLSVPADGIVSLAGAEVDSTHRFRVPFILTEAAEADAERLALTLRQREGEWELTQGAAFRIVVSHAPFALTLWAGNTVQATLNGRGLFTIEHLRTKQDGDPAGWWEEDFKSHKDSKPRGPQAISLDLDFPAYKHVYGIPEHASSFALRPTVGEGVTSEPYRLYNLDVFEYVHDSPFGLYGSVPFMVAHNAARTVGAFWLNAAEMYIDVGRDASGGTTTQWIAESGMLQLYLLLGPSPADVSKQYAWLTGGNAMPQYFSIGYHQCRWNYKDEEDVRNVDAGFDEHGISYDVIWLDIEHTDGKRYMTWDSQYFPNPIELQHHVSARGRKTITIIDPHMKRDDNYRLFSEATAKGLFVKTHEGNDFDGWCWPGSSSYLDVLSPEVRDWWADQFALDKYAGSTLDLYVWNDMNEPSVFNGPEITMHKDCKHYNNTEHRDVHNAYGLYYHRATAEGLLKRARTSIGPDGDRPFVLTRAFFAGSQAIGPLWTGDNTADWDHLRVSIPMVLSVAVTGNTFAGADVGGFFGNPDAELMVRWYQLGALHPFFRGHAHLEAKRREPWLFGDDSTAIIRSAIAERYALLPYLYTAFRHANTSGTPVARPLWYDFPAQEGLFAVEDEFMLGPALLAAPVLHASAVNRTLTLPYGVLWYDYWTGQRVSAPRDPATNVKHLTIDVDMTSMPLYLKGGSVVARKERARRSTRAMANDPITLVVAPDGAGRAVGDVYMDDGKSYAFKRGEFTHRNIELVDGVLRNVRFGGGQDDAGLLVERVVFMGMEGAWKATVVEAAGKRELQVVAGACNVRVGKGDCLVVRNPGLKVGQDWQVHLTRATS